MEQVEDLKTGLKSCTVTQSEYGALITDIKNCKSGIVTAFMGLGEWKDQTCL